MCSSTVTFWNSNTIQSLKMHIAFADWVTTYFFSNCRCYVLTYVIILFWYSFANIEENHECLSGQLVPLQEFTSGTSYTHIILFTAHLETKPPNNVIFILNTHESNTIYYMIFTSMWNPLANYVISSFLNSIKDL
jgi:hypothetical protein